MFLLQFTRKNSSYLYVIYLFHCSGNVVLGAVGKLTSALALNSTKLSAIHLQEDEHQNIDFYISGIPDGYSGELKIEVNQLMFLPT